MYANLAALYSYVDFPKCGLSVGEFPMIPKIPQITSNCLFLTSADQIQQVNRQLIVSPYCQLTNHSYCFFQDEESVRDRFKARTLIGWLQDIKDNFHLEKVITALRCSGLKKDNLFSVV